MSRWLFFQIFDKCIADNTFFNLIQINDDHKIKISFHVCVSFNRKTSTDITSLHFLPLSKLNYMFNNLGLLNDNLTQYNKITWAPISQQQIKYNSLYIYMYVYYYFKIIQYLHCS